MRHISRAILRLLLPSVLIGVFLTGSGSQVLGQNARPRAVARLITTITDAPKEGSDAGNPTGAKTAVAVAGPLPSLAEASPIERRAFERTNAVRVANGLEPLAWDAELCRLARVHSQGMATSGTLSHVSPDGWRLKDRARGAGIRYRVIAENIAYNQGYENPGEFAVERWMTSGAHRENILDKVFQSSAVGVFIDAEGCVYLTQLFIQR